MWRTIEFERRAAIVRIGLVAAILLLLPMLEGCSNMKASSVAQSTPQAQSMESMLSDVDQVRAFVYGSGTRSQADQAAADLLSWSQRMAELFPPGQASVDYVDMSSERARAAPPAMTRTAEVLLSAVRIADRATIGDRLARLEREGCGACHLSKLP